ncbi:MAG: DsbA family protein [Limisphaerales bacterium]
MQIRVIYYLEVISSWCHWAEPAWDELKSRFGHVASFEWRVALLGPDGMPASQAQEDWFYRRSGVLMRSPTMLNSGWFEPGRPEYLPPNLLAEAAKDFGVADDRVRRALSEAAVLRGLQVGRWEVAGPIAAHAADTNELALVQRARTPEMLARIRASTDEFHALKVTQRPTFVFEDEIGDRAVISGLATVEPLAAVMNAMLRDCEGYASWKAHFGEPPPA